ncbi:MAG: MATE family efflux transporter [Rhodanobacteraceae bacterium]
MPILGDNVLQSLNVSINSIWIGHYLGEAALTASSNANLILFFLIGTMFGLSMASTILVGQAMGARNPDLAKRVVGTGLTFFAGLSVIVAVLGFIFTPQVLGWMRTPADAIPDAVAYLRVIFVLLPATLVYVLLRMTLRGTGDSRTPFQFMVLAVVLDIGLNPLLIFGWGPIPGFGIAGSATATLIAQVVALVGLVVTLYRRGHFLCIHRGQWHYLKPEPALLRAVVLKGLPMGAQMMVISASSLIMIAFINQYGSRMTAAYGAALQLWRYIQVPAIAVGSTVASMAAQNVGAQLWQRVTRIAGAGVVYNLIMTGTLVVVVYLFARDAVGLFLPADPVALDLAKH